MYPLGDSQAYASWAREHDRLSEDDRDAIRRCSDRVPDLPLFSIVIPAPAPGLGTLARRALASVEAQLCPRWEVLAPAALLEQATDRGTVPLPDTPGDDPAALCNAALARASGEFLVVLPPHGAVAEHAVFELAMAAVANPGAELVFSDEDCIDASGQRCTPRFKTAWDPDLMLGCNAVGNVAAMRTSSVRGTGGFRGAPSLGIVQYDLLLRLGEAVPPSRIHHVPSILYHCLLPPGPGSGWDAEAARAVVRRHLAESGTHGAEVAAAPLLPACNRIVRPVPSPRPLVSIVVPTRDKPEFLARCAEGILSRTDYAPIELLIIDNDSRERDTGILLAQLGRDPRVRVLPFAGRFDFARMNNAAVQEARGEVVVLLNNDTDMIGPGWLTELVSHAVRPEVGAVGAKLLYADGRVQHCGVALGPGWALIHQLRKSDHLDPGPGGELALVRNASAVTGACVAFRKEVFLEVGGLNDDFKVAFNDIDLCLRMGDHGYRIVCTPFAELFHLESATRGQDDTPEKRAIYDREAKAFRRLWDPLLDADPFHNPNVVYRWEESVLATPPRRQRPWQARPRREGSQPVAPGLHAIVEEG